MVLVSVYDLYSMGFILWALFYGLYSMGFVRGGFIRDSQGLAAR
jgi:hypothetical protein